METRKVLHIWREDEEDPLIQDGLYISLYQIKDPQLSYGEQLGILLCQIKALIWL